MKSLVRLLAILCVLAPLARASEPFVHDAANQSLRNEVKHAIGRGLAWMETAQAPDGHWSSPDYPALTALPLTAFMREPESTPRDAEFIRKGYAFLEASVHPDGGIYRKAELQNYNTCLSMLALVASGDKRYEPILAAARQFVIGQQNHFTRPGEQPNPLDGGIGYGDDEPHSDLSNTMTALEALRATRTLAQKQEKSAAKELNWDAAIGFVTRCQNLPATNPEHWASDDPENKGGFVYYPGTTNAGETKLPGGRVALRSYGTMSYAGLLSYIYADLKHDDPRVQAAMEWLGKNYTVQENPGMGKQGLFYYYNLMAKTLAITARDNQQWTDKPIARWKEDLAKQLLNLQQPDGKWANTNGRFWEKDPVLASSYALLALEFVYSSM